MKLETYLNAAVATAHHAHCDKYPENQQFICRSNRQYRAFRARILRVDAEKDRDIRLLKDGNFILAKLMVERVAAKDARIAELEKWVDDNATLVHVHKGSGPNDYEWSDIDD